VTVADDVASRPSSWLGSRVKRVEDPRLLTGRGQYVDDIDLPGALQAAVLRSPLPHARIRSIDTAQALALPGVHAVLTAADIDEMGLGELPNIWIRPGQKNLSNPLLAREKVRFVGEPLAIVAAEDRGLAETAIEQILVDYEELPPLVDALTALEPDAPLLHEEWGDNVVVTLTREGGDVDQAFRDAEVVISERLVSHRYTGVPLETRGILARLEPDNSLTLWMSTQVVHHARDVIARVLKWPEHRVRVIAQDVGGGFGPKDHAYAEDVLVAALSIVTRRPVKWIEDRQEHFLSTVHAREQVHDVELAARKDGVILGVRDRIVANVGAYCSNVGVGPVSITADLLLGPYRIQNYRAEVYGVVTNKVPAGAYRGFGMTQGTFVMERMIERLARELDLDPVGIRLRNLVYADEMPYTSATGFVYDSGDYRAALDMALERLDHQAWRQRQAEWREQGRYVGIGIAMYVELASFTSSKRLGEMGFGIGGYEHAVVRMDPQGKVTLYTALSSQGQSHETTFAQVCADQLGVDPDDVKVVQGDTAVCPYASAGTIASRGGSVAGGAIILASRKLRTKLLDAAAHLLEANPDDLELSDRRFSVRGSPERGVELATVAEEVLLGHRLSEGMEPGLEERAVYDATSTWPYATHVAVLEVDPDTGELTFHRYIVVHDCGTMINPTVVEGQIHGGVAQGIGGAILEDLVYDEDGQPLTTSFMDYLLPAATDLPNIEVGHLETPSPYNPGGMKGMGEGGAIGPPAAIASAIEDALSPFGVKVTETPLSPERIWRLVRDGRRSA
jgi:carbon-monoxide dehydrogenase large subunit